MRYTENNISSQWRGEAALVPAVQPVQMSKLNPVQTVRKRFERIERFELFERSNARCALDFFSLMREIVDEHILAEAVGAAVEGAAFVDAGKIVDEAA